jgi:hypothetical protein
VSDTVQDWLDAHPYLIVVVLAFAVGSAVMAFAFAAVNGSLMGCVLTGLAAIGLFGLCTYQTQAERERQGEHLFDDIDDHP